MFASSNQRVIFGIEDAGNDDRKPFEEYISQYHTGREMERIKLEVMPNMKSMEAGDVVTSTIEFATPNVLLLFGVTMRNIGRSCMDVTFIEHKA